MRGPVQSNDQMFGMGAGENTVTMFRWDGCRWSADAQSDCDLPCTVASHGSATACGLLSSALGNALQIDDPPKQCQRASCQPVPARAGVQCCNVDARTVASTSLGCVFEDAGDQSEACTACAIGLFRSA